MKDDFLTRKLDQRASQGLLRKLSVNQGLIDFCSNDYLGFANSGELISHINNFPQPPGHSVLGSKGSRLLAGNSPFVEQLEQFIAAYHQAESGLIFNSGYDANVGFFSSVPGKGDLILYDELIHASVHDGMRMGRAEARAFRHNDPEALLDKLSGIRSDQVYEGEVFVAVESVYSMDGDLADLERMMAVCELFNAHLIVDEAHATGVIGRAGKGLVNELGLSERVFARLHTFGKALGTHGAIVLGSHRLRDFLINFARSFIYTTALPYHALISIRCAYELLPQADRQRSMLQHLNGLFRAQLEHAGSLQVLPGNTPVQSVLVPGNEQVRKAAASLQAAGFDVRPIVAPTVPAGSERLRICIHAFNTEEEITSLTAKLISL